MNTENLSHTVDRLTAAGYTENFKAEENGLRATNTGELYSPDSLVVDEFMRFEGETNPDDEAIVFALRCPKSGVKGTYTVAYGKDMDTLDIDMVHKLSTKD